MSNVDGELAGFVIGITADRRWEEQAELFGRRGATIMHGPSIRTLPVDGSDELRSVTEALIERPPTHVLANTALGVRSWIGAAECWGLGDELLGVIRAAHVVARGPKASAAIHQLGLDVAQRALTERLDEAVDLLLAHGMDGARVAFMRHGESSPAVIERLAAAGADVVEIPIYRWTVPADLRPVSALIDAVLGARVDAVTFTSAPAVRNMFDVAVERGVAEALTAAFNQHVATACVGPVCAEAATEAGIGDVVIPERFRIGPMVRCLTERLVTRSLPVQLNGVPIEFRGGGLITPDGFTPLSSRDTAMLRHLLARRPAVVSKAELLRVVWGAETADEHAVEVAIGRLRRRLARLGASIVSVSKRGYTVV